MLKHIKLREHHYSLVWSILRIGKCLQLKNNVFVLLIIIWFDVLFVSRASAASREKWDLSDPEQDRWVSCVYVSLKAKTGNILLVPPSSPSLPAPALVTYPDEAPKCLELNYKEEAFKQIDRHRLIMQSTPCSLLQRQYFMSEVCIMEPV